MEQQISRNCVQGEKCNDSKLSIFFVVESYVVLLCDLLTWYGHMNSIVHVRLNERNDFTILFNQ